MMTRRKMQARYALIACMSVGLGMSAIGVVQGQYSTGGMFGSRTLGGSVSGRSDNLSSAGTPGNRLDQQQNVGQITGTERFLRDARQPGQFVGSDSAESSFIGAMSSGYSSAGSGMYGGGMGGRGGTMGAGMLGTTGLGGMNQRGMGQLGGQRGTMGGQRGANRLGTTGRMGGMGGRNRSVNLQTQLTVDFRYPRLQATKVRSTVERRLNSSSRIQKAGPLQFEVVDRIATLRGVVATEADRELAVRIVQLEPGISEVRDELSVASSDAPTPP